MIGRETLATVRSGWRRRPDTTRKVPPFSSGFPAFAARSSRVQHNGRKRRSCSPSLTYVISCRDSGLRRSAHALGSFGSQKPESHSTPGRRVEGRSMGLGPLLEAALR